MSEPNKRFRCRHIHADGRQCGSPSLRGEEFCYFHHTTRPPAANLTARRPRQTAFTLPNPEDRASIQISIGEVLRRIAENTIDPKRAGLLLYGLQIASLNLPRTPTTDTTPVEEVVQHPTLGALAPQTEVVTPTAEPRFSLARMLMDSLEKERPGTEAELLGQYNQPPISVISTRAERPAVEPTPTPFILPNLQATATPEQKRAGKPRRAPFPPSCSLSAVPCSLSAVLCSLFPVPCLLFLRYSAAPPRRRPTPPQT